MHRGKIVILAIVASALLLAGYAWWHRYQQGRQAMELWGTQNAVLIRHAPRVELLTLGAKTSSTGPAETLKIDEQELAILKRQDFSRARGLVHARHVLIEDTSFDWQGATDNCGGDWTYALRFSDETQAVHVVFDLNCGRAWLVETNADVRLVPRIKEALAKYIRDHSDVPPPRS